MSVEHVAAQDHRLWKCFVEGATQRSWFALVFTLVVCTLTFAYLTSIRFETSVIENIGLFRSKNGSDPNFDATVHSLQLRHERASHVPAVMLIGSTRWAGEILETPHPETASRGELVDLATPGQTWWESESLIDWTTDRPGVVVADVSLPRFLVPKSTLRKLAVHPKLGFRSRAFDREIDAAGLPTRSMYDRYLLDNVSFFIDRWPNLLMNVVFGPSSASDNRSTDISPHLLNHEDLDEDTFQTNAKAFRRFIEIATRKTRFDVILVAVDPPESASELVERRNGLVTDAAQSSRINVILSSSPIPAGEKTQLWVNVRGKLEQSHE